MCGPDYLLVHKDVYDRFMKILKETIRSFYGKNPLKALIMDVSLI